MAGPRVPGPIQWTKEQAVVQVIVQRIQVEKEITNVLAIQIDPQLQQKGVVDPWLVNQGWFWVAHTHGGYSSIMPLLIACLNTQKAGSVSCVANTHTQSDGIAAQVDWFQWPA